MTNHITLLRKMDAGEFLHKNGFVFTPSGTVIQHQTTKTRSEAEATAKQMGIDFYLSNPNVDFHTVTGEIYIQIRISFYLKHLKPGNRDEAKRELFELVEICRQHFPDVFVKSEVRLQEEPGDQVIQQMTATVNSGPYYKTDAQFVAAQKFLDVIISTQKTITQKNSVISSCFMEQVVLNLESVERRQDVLAAHLTSQVKVLAKTSVVKI